MRRTTLHALVPVLGLIGDVIVLVAIALASRATGLATGLAR